ncbi:Uncharacterised protein [Campylobacter geochelonis]|uniref:Uncharacterized protein n=1 Tax=Campylobacter geochelonis TaxID=1780362 RepID=A0A128ELU5_9BACT|nr:Uncharacterised protein [Campylobacter geochelonis]
MSDNQDMKQEKSDENRHSCKLFLYDKCIKFYKMVLC